MGDQDIDTLIRMAAFEHVRRLAEVHDHLTATELKPGFIFGGERFPLINPQRGIFKPQQMKFLLSIKTVFPKPGGKIWYDDQRLHVSERLLGQKDGPMLEALKLLNGGTIHLPKRPQDQPDKDRLALRFERFKAVA